MKAMAIIAAIIWTVGFALEFVIKAKSPYLWIPDTLLLVGFLPLLFAWKPSWPWFLFGLGNLFIGFVLVLGNYLPDADLNPVSVPVKHHLSEMHVAIIWIIAGLAAICYGTLRLVKNFVIRLKNKKQI